MNYDREAFFALMEAVEAQGGSHLDETCDPQIVAPDDWVGPKTLPAEACDLSEWACGHSAIFEVPYNAGPFDPEDSEPVRGTVKVCAVEDDLGRWPRFAGALA